jgi:hypothetical protein
MKKLFLMATMLLMFGAVNAQIGDVKVDGSSAKIYDDKGKNTYKSISLCSNCSVKNVTPSGILIKDGSTTKIYDFNGKYTYKSY